MFWQLEEGGPEGWQLEKVLLALKMEGGASNQGVPATSKVWQRQGNGFFPRVARKEHSPADTLALGQEDSFCTFDLWG